MFIAYNFAANGVYITSSKSFVYNVRSVVSFLAVRDIIDRLDNVIAFWGPIDDRTASRTGNFATYARSLYISTLWPGQYEGAGIIYCCTRNSSRVGVCNFELDENVSRLCVEKNSF